MRRLRVGDIVVVMKPCHQKCTVCLAFIGNTALVKEVSTFSSHIVTLRFAGDEDGVP
ncbi:hypothetical protein LCGC14_2159300, partial [marine sediment metagenome]